MAKESLKGPDKKKHFLVCFLVSMFSPSLAVGLALGKEMGDKYAKGNHWCWWDLLADGLGILLGGAIHFLILWDLAVATGIWIL